MRQEPAPADEPGTGLAEPHTSPETDVRGAGLGRPAHPGDNRKEDGTLDLGVCRCKMLLGAGWEPPRGGECGHGVWRHTRVGCSAVGGGTPAHRALTAPPPEVWQVRERHMPQYHANMVLIPPTLAHSANPWQ